MRKITLSIIALLAITFTSFGQAPEGFKYQSVIRDASNAILINQPVGIRLTILQTSPTGTAVYTETFSETSNAYGLVNLEIGTGTTTDDFSAIDWASGPYFIETAIDVTGGTTYAVMGTSQLMSVPYALYSKTSGDAFSGNYSDLTGAPANVSSFTNDAGYISDPDDADADPSNEMNISVVLNGTNLETTDGGGTIVTDLSGIASGGANWTLNGTNIYNGNSGSVVVGSTLTNSNVNFVVTNNSSPKASIGNIGAFNNINCGELLFAEDVNYGSECGMKFQHNGSLNNLYLVGGCSTPDTIARFNRSGFSNLKQLRVGLDRNSNTTYQLEVDGISGFNGNVTITGDLNVTGNIAKGGGTFKIDHPMDPENKYLIHSFVESPEMMNIFSGNITTDQNGMAYVQMPDYFEAANKDFRYQLTVIGTFAQAIVKEKIKGNVFVIQTNQPNVEVSWAVTSVRADKYADKNRIAPVVEKEFKGSYIHPELYGFGQEKSESAAKSKFIQTQKTQMPSANHDGQ